MDKYEVMLNLLTEAIQSGKSNGFPVEANANTNEIPIGVSNRHLHLSQADLYSLFGEGYELTRTKDLSQPGQYACKETVTICGPKGSIEKIRILGPVRNMTQVEIMTGDCFKLGVISQIRLSGDLQGTRGITIIGPRGSVQTKEGLIVAQRHIHMTPKEANRFGVCDGQSVSIKFNGLRGGTYDSVAIRANSASKLECHIDVEEANAMNINSLSKVTIVK